MYTTTFPCHECARHIVAAGIAEVIYLEPYPKSGIKYLFHDSIDVDPTAIDDKRVAFHTFVGVAPPRYLEFFTVGTRDRKNDEGYLEKVDVKIQPPSLPYYTPTPKLAIAAETAQLGLFSEFVEHLLAERPNHQ